MVDGGVSVIASSCGHDLTPSVMRAVGSQVAAQGRHVTVYVCRSQSASMCEVATWILSMSFMIDDIS